MSVIVNNVISWKLNPDTQCVEFKATMPETNQEITIIVPESKFSEIVQMVPSLEEERQTLAFIKQIQDIRTKQLLTVDEVNKLADDLRKKHDDLRKRLQNPNIQKNEISSIAVESKDLGTEKVLIDTKRHLVGLLMKEEQRARVELAKRKAGIVK